MDDRRRRRRGVGLIWLEIVIGFAVPIGYGVWQLIDLKREKRRDEAKRAAQPVDPV